MTATQDLIAAALTVRDVMQRGSVPEVYSAVKDLRELCARAMVQPVGEVPMPEPVAYGFGNTAITGHTNRLMMVRIDIPGDDQYAGAFWLPLVLADEARTYGDACRAAGYAAGVAAGDVPEADFGNMLDCRTCAHFTADGCNSTVMCMEADQYKATVPRRYWATMSGEVKP